MKYKCSINLRYVESLIFSYEKQLNIDTPTNKVNVAEECEITKNSHVLMHPEGVIRYK